MPHPEYPIRTSRLLLRPFTPSDVDAVLAIYSRPDVVRHLFEDPFSPEDARRAVTRWKDMTRIDDDQSVLRLAVERDDTGQVIGDVMLERLGGRNRQGEIGFVFHPDHHGQGFALEAAQEMVRLGFAELDLHRVIGRCDARNTGSATLMERLGMRREACLRENQHVKGEWCDELVFGVLAGEWEARQLGADAVAQR
ncbi:Protein N-acetyltransferase, RimJ/RimL family [Streptoalloteichus tenebrarius]|uniref:Protein N-acetyltransferase, RimJ/RimL family n=1 Tax=Streptoalloteichus tenebrarius (strain ATCC 17920 / DSM 40477 / JCM 4838 / CBS 697.72 / NBRC 16177 / NCIMB 11028 / NRRL B-12390 / A12253. 1 / ISP 5477) TaxID=1933 RepID=A0ABT1HUL4_STRSD|nr:GNAT family N-acetyltransferase [Streptoalloteichus tenebrarius]MCP2259216.1 Protein N-acetyltransferase, RimJ/RimL family [Streptoalloteichus tenebrarius]BFF04303.1 GNAT family protein [Streptoalloteichus tenebrarius]